MKKLLGFLLLSLAASVSFAEDAYLESDGTQYIVTGYYPTEKRMPIAAMSRNA